MKKKTADSPRRSSHQDAASATRSRARLRLRTALRAGSAAQAEANRRAATEEVACVVEDLQIA